ncbi:MAG TPA: hypothetical protein VGT61_13860 [Thermomicrobiales bacterium]|jgi:catechol 2,3-dioxygenase-like lactoylglutathione lyase family enzyme|nr:hypothetical protein [Thermomicrobiales bacterium]
MLNGNQAFSRFSVTDFDAARTFYGDTFGLSVTDDAMGFLTLESGTAMAPLSTPAIRTGQPRTPS